MKKNKLAVFIAGPSRYVFSVTNQLNTIFTNKDFSFDFFYFIWKEDLGNKRRREEEIDYESLISSSKTKVLILNQPYTAEKIIDISGIKKDNSHSSINAMIGMFVSMNILSTHLSLLPDFDDYTHILRLRTDCLILNEDFINEKMFSSNDVYVSKNYAIPENWISDHIMLAPVCIFNEFWKFKDINEIVKFYIKGGKNPERMLAHIANVKKIQVNSSIVRYEDYHIIYNPPKEYDPQTLKDYLNKYKTLSELFQNPRQYLDINEFVSLNNNLYKNLKKLNESFRKKSFLERVKNKLKRYLK